MDFENMMAELKGGHRVIKTYLVDYALKLFLEGQL